MKCRYILILIVGATVLTACGTQIGELKPEDTSVFNYIDKNSGFHGLVINVSEDEAKLEISKPGIKACIGNINGCLNLRVGSRLNIGFKLADVDIADDWYFKEFSVCKGADKPSSDCTLERYERREFDIRASKKADDYFAPGVDGKIDLGQVGSDPTQFVLHIENSIRQNYFYNIQACNEAKAKCLNLDPRITNRGRR